MAKPSVPQFGNWESQDNVPYTVYFDKARKNKGGKPVNPTDPQGRADVFPQAQPHVKRVAPKASTRSQISEEDSGEYRQFGSPNYRGGRSRVVNQSSHQEYVVRSGGGGSARPSRPSSIGSDYSIDRSPLRPRPTGRGNGNGNGNGNASPAYEVKRSYDSSHGTPSRLKPRISDNSRDVAIPKFGEWDVRDPQSADNYTYIFNKNARGAKGAEEKSIPSHNSHHTKNEEVDAKFSQRCCFAVPWAKR